MHTTAKEAMSQPLFYVVLALGIFAVDVSLHPVQHTR